MSVNPKAEASIVYLFSSAPPGRPNYKRGVLNALCYPAGHQLELSYRKSYISPSLFDQRSSVRGKRGMFVFLDYKKTEDHDFIPIRFVTILELSPKEEAKQFLDTTRMYIRVELGELIAFDSKWNGEIRSLPSRPKLPNLSHGPHSAAADYLYVLEGPDRFPLKSDYSQRDIWDHLVEKVADAKSLNDCVFLSTGHLRHFPGRTQCDFSSYGQNEKAYRLRPNSIYQVDLRVFDSRHSSDSTQEVVIRSSSELLTVSQPFVTGVGGPTDHSVLLVCKRSVESTLATLVVDLQPRGSALGAESNEKATAISPASVIAAKPRYLLAIAPSRALLIWFTVLVLAGAFLTSTSAEFYKDFVCLPAVWALVSKMLGAGALSAAAYIAFRKLPSGGSGS